MTDKASICASITVNLYCNHDKENYKSPRQPPVSRTTNPIKRSASLSPRSSPRQNLDVLDPVLLKHAPIDLTGQQYDVMLIYTPQDEQDMRKFQYILESSILLDNKSRPSVYMCNCDDSANFQTIMDTLQRTTNFFIYSKNGRFGNRCASHKKDEIITRCLQRRDRRLIPLLPNSSHEAPVGLRALRALYLEKLFRGKDIKNVSLKELEYSQNDEELLDRCELSALKRLLNAGIIIKQNRLVAQQNALRVWYRDYERNMQLESALQKRSTSPKTSAEKYQDTNMDSYQNTSSLDKRLSKSNTVLHDVSYTSNSTTQPVTMATNCCQGHDTCCQGQQTRCYKQSLRQVRQTPCRVAIENNEVETYDRDSC